MFSEEPDAISLIDMEIRKKHYSQRCAVNYINYSFCQEFIVLTGVAVFNRKSNSNGAKPLQQAAFLQRVDKEPLYWEG